MDLVGLCHNTIFLLKTRKNQNKFGFYHGVLPVQVAKRYRLNESLGFSENRHTGLTYCTHAGIGNKIFT